MYLYMYVKRSATLIDVCPTKYHHYSNNIMVAVE